MQIIFCEHVHINTDTHTVAWYVGSALRKIIMTMQVLPQFFCMGVGVMQARFGVLCIYMECSTYIWSSPYINIWTITSLFIYVALLLYIEHYIYMWIMAFMEHSIFKWSSAFLCGVLHILYMEHYIYIWRVFCSVLTQTVPRTPLPSPLAV